MPQMSRPPWTYVILLNQNNVNTIWNFICYQWYVLMSEWPKLCRIEFRNPCSYCGIPRTIARNYAMWWCIMFSKVLFLEIVVILLKTMIPIFYSRHLNPLNAVFLGDQEHSPTSNGKWPAMRMLDLEVIRFDDFPTTAAQLRTKKHRKRWCI